MYGTVEDADTYHAARGNTSWDSLADPAKEQALQRGTDYIDQRYREKLKSGRWVSMFSGTRTAGRSQDNEWPRTGATDYEGNELPDNEVPQEVEYATYEAALRESVTPGSLSPDYVPTEQVIQDTVGPITVKYASGSGAPGSTPNRPVIPEIDEIIAPVLVPRYDYPAVRVV